MTTLPIHSLPTANASPRKATQGQSEARGDFGVLSGVFVLTAGAIEEGGKGAAGASTGSVMTAANRQGSLTPSLTAPQSETAGLVANAANLVASQSSVISGKTGPQTQPVDAAGLLSTTLKNGAAVQPVTTGSADSAATPAQAVTTPTTTPQQPAAGAAPSATMTNVANKHPAANAPVPPGVQSQTAGLQATAGTDAQLPAQNPGQAGSLLATQMSTAQAATFSMSGEADLPAAPSLQQAVAAKTSGHQSSAKKSPSSATNARGVSSVSQTGVQSGASAGGSTASSAQPVANGGAPVPAPSTPQQPQADATLPPPSSQIFAETVPTPERADHGSSQRLETHLAVRNAAGQSQGVRMDAAAIAAFAARMAKKLDDGSTRFQLRLDPPELGRVDVSVRLSRDGKARAHLAVERPEALAELQRNARTLEKVLAENGFAMEDGAVTFDLGAFQSDGGPSGGQHEHDHRHSAAHSDNGPVKSGPKDTSGEPPASIETVFGFSILKPIRINLTA